MAGDAYIYADFPAGIITSRFVNSLSAISSQKMEHLLRTRKIVVSPKDLDVLPYGLTHYNLSWEYMEDYAEACDLPLSYFLFPDGIPGNTAFSFYDRAVFLLLQALSPEILLAAATVLRSSYYNPRFRISKDSTPSAKLVSVLLMDDTLPSLVPEEELGKYSFDINAEITRFRALRIKERTKFHIDHLIDLCTFARVSPHWLFSLTGPLLFNTPEADAFFDVFCLLNRSQQVTALSMLVDLCKSEVPGLPVAVSPELEQLIREEGSVLSCL